MVSWLRVNFLRPEQMLEQMLESKRKHAGWSSLWRELEHAKVG